MFFSPQNNSYDKEEGASDNAKKEHHEVSRKDEMKTDRDH